MRKIGSENGDECTQNAENGFTFYFLVRCRKDGDEFLNNILRVTRIQTWVSFMYTETKEQPKQWMHTHSPN
jgi:hypothetical protein